MPPDRHLVRTAIPFQPGQDSLGDFHPSRSVPLASFANRVSAGDHGRHPGQDVRRVDPASTRFTQGRLRLHTALRAPWRDAPHCRFKSASYTDPLTTVGVRPRTRTGLHGNRVVITMPLESALSPQAQAKPGFPPAPTRNWAYQAGTRGFIGVPFRGFLAPPSETDDLTRILRRRLAPYSISQI